MIGVSVVIAFFSTQQAAPESWDQTEIIGQGTLIDVVVDGDNILLSLLKTELNLRRYSLSLTSKILSDLRLAPGMCYSVRLTLYTISCTAGQEDRITSR